MPPPTPQPGPWASVVGGLKTVAKSPVVKQGLAGLEWAASSPVARGLDAVLGAPQRFVGGTIADKPGEWRGVGAFAAPGKATENTHALEEALGYGPNVNKGQNPLRTFADDFATETVTDPVMLVPGANLFALGGRLARLTRVAELAEKAGRTDVGDRALRELVEGHDLRKSVTRSGEDIVKGREAAEANAIRRDEQKYADLVEQHRPAMQKYDETRRAIDDTYRRAPDEIPLTPAQEIAKKAALDAAQKLIPPEIRTALLQRAYIEGTPAVRRQVMAKGYVPTEEDRARPILNVLHRFRDEYEPTQHLYDKDTLTRTSGPVSYVKQGNRKAKFDLPGGGTNLDDPLADRILDRLTRGRRLEGYHASRREILNDLGLGPTPSNSAEVIAAMERAKAVAESPGKKPDLFRYQATAGTPEVSPRGGTFYSVGEPNDIYSGTHLSDRLGGPNLVERVMAAKNPLNVEGKAFFDFDTFSALKGQNPKKLKQWDRISSEWNSSQKRRALKMFGVSDQDIEFLLDDPGDSNSRFLDRLIAEMAKARGHDAINYKSRFAHEYFALHPEAAQAARDEKEVATANRRAGLLANVLRARVEAEKANEAKRAATLKPDAEIANRTLEFTAPQTAEERALRGLKREGIPGVAGTFVNPKTGKASGFLRQLKRGDIDLKTLIGRGGAQATQLPLFRRAANQAERAVPETQAAAEKLQSAERAAADAQLAAQAERAGKSATRLFGKVLGAKSTIGERAAKTFPTGEAIPNLRPDVHPPKTEETFNDAKIANPVPPPDLISRTPKREAPRVQAQQEPGPFTKALIRYQRTPLEPEVSARGGTFFSPEGSPDIDYYKEDYKLGGAYRIERTLSAKNPLHVPYVPESVEEGGYSLGSQALPLLRGKPIDLRKTPHLKRDLEDGKRSETVLKNARRYLRAAGVPESEIPSVIEFANRTLDGREFNSVIKDRMVAEMARRKGYDAIVSENEVFLLHPSAAALSPEQATNAAREASELAQRSEDQAKNVMTEQEIENLASEWTIDGSAGEKKRLRNRAIANLKYDGKVTAEEAVELRKQAAELRERAATYEKQAAAPKAGGPVEAPGLLDNPVPPPDLIGRTPKLPIRVARARLNPQEPAPSLVDITGRTLGAKAPGLLDASGRPPRDAAILAAERKQQRFTNPLKDVADAAQKHAERVGEKPKLDAPRSLRAIVAPSQRTAKLTNAFYERAINRANQTRETMKRNLEHNEVLAQARDDAKAAIEEGNTIGLPKTLDERLFGDRKIYEDGILSALSDLQRDALFVLPFAHMKNIAVLAALGPGGLRTIRRGMKYAHDLRMNPAKLQPQVDELEKLGATQHYIREATPTYAHLPGIGGKLDALAEHSNRALERYDLGMRLALKDELDAHKITGYEAGGQIRDVLGDYKNQAPGVIQLRKWLGANFPAWRLGIVPRAMTKALRENPRGFTKYARAQRLISDDITRPLFNADFNLGGPAEDYSEMLFAPQKTATSQSTIGPVRPIFDLKDAMRTGRLPQFATQQAENYVPLGSLVNAVSNFPYPNNAPAWARGVGGAFGAYFPNATFKQRAGQLRALGLSGKAIQDQMRWEGWYDASGRPRLPPPPVRPPIAPLPVNGSLLAPP